MRTVAIALTALALLAGCGKEDRRPIPVPNDAPTAAPELPNLDTLKRHLSTLGTSPDLQSRLQSATLLGRAGLVAMATDPQKEYGRAYGADELPAVTKFFRDEAAPTLVAFVRQNHPAIRATGETALKNLGISALPALSRGLIETDAAVRAIVVRCLLALDLAARPSLADIRHAIQQESDVDVRKGLDELVARLKE